MPKIRYAKQIKDMHKEIYKGVYSFAGKFRTNQVTFGDINKLAITSNPKNIIKGYNFALRKFYERKGKTYDFERVITFHQEYQRIHGFQNGNSRLGRLIMMKQLLSLGYSPFLIKGTLSKSYRSSLVKAINDDNNTSLIKFFYEAYKKTFNQFWIPIIEKNL